jgi:glycyl-tRNA synthetase beta chain
MSAHQQTLLFEIGCEEIPARMIPSAAVELRRRMLELLDSAAIDHGSATAWGGSRRLAVMVQSVAGRQPEIDEVVLGPPAKIALDDSGELTGAARGFAKKQGIDATQLKSIDTDRGSYVGYRKQGVGKSLQEILAEALPAAVAGIPFAKTMRWGDGTIRWVRPVHWIVALHGTTAIALTMLGVKSGVQSQGHRFLSDGPIEIRNADEYQERLAEAFVVVDPEQRRERLNQRLVSAATERGGKLLADQRLLDEVRDLVEWPGVVVGEFDKGHLSLPQEILKTTLRYHQKCFSVVGDEGATLPYFMAVANTDKDPGGHVQRGNEWVVNGRLEDARFFWNEDLKQPLSAKREILSRVVFHAKAGTFGDKASRMEGLSSRLAVEAGLEPGDDEAV